MNIYVVTMDPAWNEDFVAVFSSIHETAKYICDTLAADEDIYLDYDGVGQIMAEREKKNYIYLYIGHHFNVRKAHLCK